MESHPVPQNVTTFEFHLIGDMTIKQFAYLAVGLTCAYLTFIFLFKSVPLIASPIIGFSIILGAAFAFVPIMERPLDHWVITFFRAIYKPTEFKFKSKMFEDNPLLFNNRLEVYLNTLNLYKNTKLHPNPSFATPKIIHQPTQLQTPKLITDIKIADSMNPSLPVKPILKVDGLDQSLKLIKQAEEVKSLIAKTQAEINAIRYRAAQPGTDSRQFTQEYQDALNELQQLNKKAAEISRLMAGLGKTGSLPRPIAQAKVMPVLSLTTIPNIINGIVADSQGSYLEGAIVIAHDKEGLPVRALKTNKLGQFVAATPLPDDTYHLSIEKEDLVFDSIQIELKGQILKPLFIKAKRIGGVT